MIPNTINVNNKVTKFGIQFIGSPLSYQLLPSEENYKIITNLSYVTFVNQTFSDLSVCFLAYEERWDLSQEHKRVSGYIK